MMEPFPRNNRTFQILDGASKGGYSVGAYNCYNDDGVIAVIRAAERCRSPAIIQVFPWTIRFQGPHFVRYVIEAAHSASVPIAVHLDHCIEPDDVKTALNLPFDSVMIDASTLEPQENIRKCKEIVQIANAKGVAIEAEMGRIEGGEDGLPNVDMETILTQPSLAKAFVQETGVQFLAPAFGNIHGKYRPGGPEASWRLDLLMDVHHAIPHIPLVLHGTHGVSDELFRKARKYGILKINLNRTVRDEYTDFVAKNAGKLELTTLKMQGVDIYAKSIERVMRHVLGSAGKA
ncbi:aldolase [Hypoxylon sp. NC0597]|nr:aldolase [Hypoxylon sp. NC0597]